MNGRFHGIKIKSTVYSVELSKTETIGLSKTSSSYTASTQYTQNYFFSTETGNFEEGSTSSNPNYFYSRGYYYKYTRSETPRSLTTSPYYCNFLGYRVERINCENTYEKDDTKIYENVKSSNINEYPKNDRKNNYWYELINN